jgi:trans-2,3-dihydro-3-hydroxyanthranilate isomerase
VNRRVCYLDVFAARPLAGNGLAVVDSADGVSDAVMLAYARETRLSETTYVQASEAAGADYRNRIWTPGGELPFAGHPSLGTAVAVARWRGEERAALVQETGAGMQPVDVRRENEREGGAELWQASMLQAETVFGPELDPARAMRAVGLAPSDAHPELPPQIVSTGVPHGIAPIADPAALARAAPDYPAIDELLGADQDAVVLYLAHPDPGGGRGRARSFARIVEVGEDPATGSAVGPLCAYLERRIGLGRITVSQGEEMGRPSVLHAAMDGGRARVSGAVVPLVDGTIALPDEP